MRKVVTSLIAAAAAGFAFSASAADLPVKAPFQQVAPQALFNWNGWYGGANAGYSWGRSAIDYAIDPTFVFGSPAFQNGGRLSSSLSPKSFIGGGQFGFNYQTGVWVLGFETDIAWRDRTESVNIVPDPSTGDTVTFSDSQKWVGTVRGRIGLTPTTMSNWLFYATGGLANGHFEHSVTQFCNIGCGITRSFSDSVTKVGWTLGGGVEVALTQNWSLGAEYLYMDFGTDTLSAPAAGVGLIIPATATFTATRASFHDTSQVARLKLNYKFGGFGVGLN
jgi:outer membrane immunogenic protein